jgi:cation diffusion facilitator CzcD-associated flavoprotein CzcO
VAEARRPSVVIVGAGLGGIGTAIELRRHGFDEVRILEKASGLGGTWWYNRYPLCACDVPSHLYSFSFAQRREWSRICSPREEILRYIEEVALEHGIDRLVVPATEVARCAWDEDSCRWSVSSSDGRRWETDAVVIATGQLHQPAIPRIAGAERFAGQAFHSSRWPDAFDARGKRVAVIGTGASAIQFIPFVAEQAEQLYVLQRTGNWFLPRKNQPYPQPISTLIRRVPGLQAFRRRFIYHYGEFLTLMIRHPRTWGRIGHFNSSLHMRRQLRGHPELRRKIWPDYTFGCKRILFSSDFLPTLARPNVELITEPIARLEQDGIVTADAAKRQIDCLIYGTGFRTNDFMFPMEITGRDGTTLRQAWAEGPHAHLGIAVSGFPSLFLMYGPNTNTSGGSIITYEEAQAGYIRQALERVRWTRAAAIEVRAEVEAASDREVQERFAGTAWTHCNSWYRDASGRIVANWPGYVREYEERVRSLDPSEYELIPAPAREPIAA